jgi:hypothetical protein
LIAANVLFSFSQIWVRSADLRRRCIGGPLEPAQERPLQESSYNPPRTHADFDAPPHAE